MSRRTRNYTDDDLKNAVNDVKNKIRTFRGASEAYNIPISVISNRISGK